MRDPFGDKPDLDKWKAFHVEIAKLHVENNRLRAINAELVATLQNIAEHNDFCSDWPHDIENMQERARAALAKAREPFGDKRDLDKWRAFHVEIAKLHVEIDRLRTLNAELVKTLEVIVKYPDWTDHACRARAALAKAKEQ